MTPVPPSDGRAPLFPVSIKGVVTVGDKFVLLLNERDEWELPGGKLEAGEVPVRCLAREIEEELSLGVSVEDLLDCWLYRITPSIEVLIVTYGTRTQGSQKPVLSHEHKQVGLFGLDEVPRLKMPRGYVESILRWAALPSQSR